jgi:hypothetical protein
MCTGADVHILSHTSMHARKMRDSRQRKRCEEILLTLSEWSNQVNFSFSVAADEGEISTSGGWTHAEDFWAMQMIEGIKAYSRHDGAK